MSETFEVRVPNQDRHSDEFDLFTRENGILIGTVYDEYHANMFAQSPAMFEEIKEAKNVASAMLEIASHLLRYYEIETLMKRIEKCEAIIAAVEGTNART